MKILIISPYFPPYPSVATVRVNSFTRYLLNRGCEVTVVTNELVSSDSTRFKIEGLTIVEVALDDRGSFAKNYYRNSSAYKRVIKSLLNEERFDISFVTMGPFYTLSLCKYMKKRYDLNYIMDFRDLFVFETIYKKNKSKIVQMIGKFIFYPIERSAIKYALKVLTVTDGWAGRLKQFYPSYKDKIIVIPNGYDDLLLNSVDIYAHKDVNTTCKDKLVIANYGKLAYYSKEYAEELFKAIKLISQDIAFLHVGEKEDTINDILTKYEIKNGVYNCTGFCDYTSGITKISRADILVIVDVRPQALGTKIYDYIFLNKPIIYIGPKNTVLAEFIMGFENGFIAETYEEIYNHICYIKSNNIKSLCDSSISKKYARSHQSLKLYELLKQCVE